MLCHLPGIGSPYTSVLWQAWPKTCSEKLYENMKYTEVRMVVLCLFILLYKYKKFIYMCLFDFGTFIHLN